jgi:hypothetical protein
MYRILQKSEHGSCSPITVFFVLTLLSRFEIVPYEDIYKGRYDNKLNAKL